MKNAVLNAFLPTRDIDKAKEFYVQLLGLDFIIDNGFSLELKSGGVPIRLTRVESFEPDPFTVLGWEVIDIKSTIQELLQKGLVFEKYPGIHQDELGIWSAPGGTLVAWFKDPDGNVLSLSQHGF